MKTIILTIAVLTLALSSALAADAPNIIIFLVDDQGWTGTSVQMDNGRSDSKSGYYRTPALQRLAEHGMCFSQAYSAHPNCSPSRMSIQTGKSPVRLGSTDILDVVPGQEGFMKTFYDRFYVNKPMNVPLPITDLPDEETTIAEFIKTHRPAYATAHFGKWHMKGGSPSNHGYDEHDGPTTNREGNEPDPDAKRIYSITNRFTRFIREQHDKKKPFFLQVSHYAVHTPIRARPESIRECEAREAGQYHTNAGYAAMTQNLDESLDTLLKLLDELGIADDTYIFYTSDNGGEITTGSRPTVNTPLRKGKTHTWEGGIRVPFIVKGPGIDPGSNSDVPVIGWDFFPTIAELLSIDQPMPSNMDGGSFADILNVKGEGAVKRPTRDFVWYYPHYRDMKGVRPQAAIRSGDFKLRKEYETDRLMLFDLSKDIEESNDLSESQPDLTAKLHKKMEDYLSAVGAKKPTKNLEYDPAKDLGRQGGGFRGPRRPVSRDSSDEVGPQQAQELGVDEADNKAPDTNGDIPESREHVFHRAGSTELYRRGPMLSEFILTAEQTEGRYSIVKEIFKPGMNSNPGHYHQSHSEVFFILSGVMDWTVNGETQQLGPGDLVYIPPNAPHACRVVGNDDVHALMIYEPAGYERNYFRRRALSEEERRDPETMRKLMLEADVHQNR